MRTLSAELVTRAVRGLCMEANRCLPEDVAARIRQAAAAEENPTAVEIFRQLQDNISLAKETGLPLCQDTGLAVFFVEAGQELHIEGDLSVAINEGVRQGYREGFLRASACHPFTRANTGDNTPAVIHYDLVPGDALRIAFMAKGGGAENMSRVTMLAPSDGWEGIKEFVLRRVAEAGANPCPPVIIGVGIGAGLHGFVPDNWFAENLGAGEWWTVPASVFVAIPLYSNVTGIVPIMESLLVKGLPIGTTMAFCMSAVAASIPEVMMLRQIMTIKLQAAFIGYLWIIFTLVGWLFNILGPYIV